MSKTSLLYREKVSKLIELWSKLLNKNPSSREELCETLREIYEENGLRPFKGAASPEDIYDKELVSLYVVGRYGLGLMSEYTSFFQKYFARELEYERLIEKLLGENISPETIDEIDGLSQNDVARMLRILFTKAVLGLGSEGDLVKAVKNLLKFSKKHKETARKYSKFYIAYKLAEGIAAGTIRSRVGKEAAKQAYMVKMDVERGLPDDSYIAKLLKNNFPDKKRYATRVLSIAKRGRRRKTTEKRWRKNVSAD